MQAITPTPTTPPVWAPPASPKKDHNVLGIVGIVVAGVVAIAVAIAIVVTNNKREQQHDSEYRGHERR
jgi:ethanolamine transporter EutH